MDTAEHPVGSYVPHRHADDDLQDLIHLFPSGSRKRPLNLTPPPPCTGRPMSCWPPRPLARYANDTGASRRAQPKHRNLRPHIKPHAAQIPQASVDVEPPAV